MYTGNIGTIKATEHRIDLKPNTTPIRQIPYQAGPKSREVLEEHIQKQLEANITEPELTDWASPGFLALRKTEQCVSVSNFDTLTHPPCHTPIHYRA